MDTNSQIKEYFLYKERNVVSLKEITLYMIKINHKALLGKIFELQGKISISVNVQAVQQVNRKEKFKNTNVSLLQLKGSLKYRQF